MKLRDFTVVALQPFYIDLAGKETAVEFAGLSGCCGCDEKCVEIITHEAT